MNVGKVDKKPYRDDPDAVSLHTTPGDVVPELASSSSSSPPPPTYDESRLYQDPDRFKYPYPGLNNVDCHFAGVSSSVSVWQKKRKTHISGEHVNIQNAHADNDPEYLQGWVKYMSRQPPTPYIVVQGTHSEQRREQDGKQKRVEVTDFDIKVNMRNYLWPNFRSNDPAMMELSTVENKTETWRGTSFKRSATGAKGRIELVEDKPTLQEWCHRYCASPSKTRIFRLDRAVEGFDQEQFQQRLTHVIRATGYKGHLNIFFPVADRAVNIYTSNRINNWRLNSWICWFFYLTFLWIVSWPLLILRTKRFNIVTATWRFSTVDAHGNRQYTTVSEDQWVDKYGPAIKQLAWDGFQGVAGDHMLEQVLARPETHRPVPAEFRAAPAALGAVMGASRSPLNAVTQVGNLLRFAGGSGDQVGWGYDS